MTDIEQKALALLDEVAKKIADRLRSKFEIKEKQ